MNSKKAVAFTDQHVRMIFSPGVLAVETNSQNMRGFLFGQPPVWPDVESETEALVTLRYSILPSGDARLLPGASTGLRRSRKIAGGIRATRLIDVTEPKRLRLAVNRAYVRWSSLRFTASHPRPEQILSNLAVVGLLSEAVLPLHAAAVAKGNDASLIFAPSDTGKTYSTWLLVSEFGYNFLGDDILATDGSTVHGFPFTATGVPPGAPASAPQLASRLRKLVMTYPNKPRLADALPERRIRAAARVRRIIFLRRGPENLVTVGRGEAAKRILQLNRMEFRHLGMKYLSQLWWECGFPELHRLALQEKEIIDRTIATAAEIVEIRSENPAGFAPRISEVIG